MKKVRLELDGMDELLVDKRVQKELERRAQRVADQANANAPVGETGALSQSHYTKTEYAGDSVTRRVVVRIVSDLDYAAKVEAGTGYFSSAMDAGVES